MFGRKRHKSNSEKFIIGKGVDAGNLKGRGTAQKSAPTHRGTALSSLGLPESKNSTNYAAINRGKS